MQLIAAQKGSDAAIKKLARVRVGMVAEQYRGTRPAHDKNGRKRFCRIGMAPPQTNCRVGRLVRVVGDKSLGQSELGVLIELLKSPRQRSGSAGGPVRIHGPDMFCDRLAPKGMRQTPLRMIAPVA